MTRQSPKPRVPDDADDLFNVPVEAANPAGMADVERAIARAERKLARRALAEPGQPTGPTGPTGPKQREPGEELFEMTETSAPAAQTPTRLRNVWIACGALGVGALMAVAVPVFKHAPTSPESPEITEPAALENESGSESSPPGNDPVPANVEVPPRTTRASTGSETQPSPATSAPDHPATPLVQHTTSATPVVPPVARATDSTTAASTAATTTTARSDSSRPTSSPSIPRSTTPNRSASPSQEAASEPAPVARTVPPVAPPSPVPAPSTPGAEHAEQRAEPPAPSASAALPSSNSGAPSPEIAQLAAERASPSSESSSRSSSQAGLRPAASSHSARQGSVPNPVHENSSAQTAASEILVPPTARSGRERLQVVVMALDAGRRAFARAELGRILLELDAFPEAEREETRAQAELLVARTLQEAADEARRTHR
jgi:hypothetical protein